jgi:hypothetical protein
MRALHAAVLRTDDGTDKGVEEEVVRLGGAALALEQPEAPQLHQELHQHQLRSGSWPTICSQAMQRGAAHPEQKAADGVRAVGVDAVVGHLLRSALMSDRSSERPSFGSAARGVDRTEASLAMSMNTAGTRLLRIQPCSGAGAACQAAERGRVRAGESRDAEPRHTVGAGVSEPLRRASVCMENTAS